MRSKIHFHCSPSFSPTNMSMEVSPPPSEMAVVNIIIRISCPDFVDFLGIRNDTIVDYPLVIGSGPLPPEPQPVQGSGHAPPEYGGHLYHSLDYLRKFRISLMTK